MAKMSNKRHKDLQYYKMPETSTGAITSRKLEMNLHLILALMIVVIWLILAMYTSMGSLISQVVLLH